MTAYNGTCEFCGGQHEKIVRYSLIFILVVSVPGAIACNLSHIPLFSPTQTYTPSNTFTHTSSPTLARTPTFNETAFPGWEHYTWRRLEDVIAEVQSDVEAEESGYALFPGITFRVNLTYLDEYRSIIESRKNLLSIWVLFLRPENEEFMNLYQQEVLFLDETTQTEYWIPVQEPIIPYMKVELGKWSRITAYLMFLGADQSTRPIDYVFWMTEYDGTYPDG